MGMRTATIQRTGDTYAIDVTETDCVDGAPTSAPVDNGVFPDKYAAAAFLNNLGVCLTPDQVEASAIPTAAKPEKQQQTAVTPHAPKTSAKVYKIPAKEHLKNGATMLEKRERDIAGIVKATLAMQKDLAILHKRGLITADTGRPDADFGPDTLAAYQQAAAYVQKQNPQVKTRAQINAAIHQLAIKK
jgi:hypothetical protein